MTRLYGSDLRKLRWRELRRFAGPMQGTVLWVLMGTGLLRPKVTFDQPVGLRWSDTETSWEAIPPAYHDAMAPRIQQLRDYGYVPAAAHWTANSLTQIECAGAYLLHPSGASYGFVAHGLARVSGIVTSSTTVVTLLADDRFVATTDERAGLDYSRGAVHYLKSSSADIARAHALTVRRYDGWIALVTDVTTLARAVDALDAGAYAERLARGVFVEAPGPAAAGDVPINSYPY